MTSHEIANQLLDLPNVPATRIVIRDGEERFEEIRRVEELDGEEERDGNRFGRAHIHLS